MTKTKRVSPALQKAGKMEKSQPPVQPNYLLFVTCLYDNSDKIAKLIKNYLNLFINTSLSHMPIESRLVSQPNKKLKLNCEQ